MTNGNEQSMILDRENLNKIICEGKQVEALKIVLSLAPMESNNRQEKDNFLAIVMAILVSIQKHDIEEFVQKLDEDHEKLTLMKYIYRGFEKPVKGSSAILLIWHEYIFESTGYGIIARVLSDRNEV